MLIATLTMPKIIKCPYCKKETTWENNPHKPFCSERCRLIDLGKWASEEYTIPDKENRNSETNPVNEDEQ